MFSDNGFDIYEHSHTPYEVTLRLADIAPALGNLNTGAVIRGVEDIALEELEKRLCIRSLYDTYEH